MSYHIFYKKQFIKVDEKRCIPFYQGGDNNLYETRNNNKRARDWSNTVGYNGNKHIIANNDELLQAIVDWRNSMIANNTDVADAVIDKQFGYYGAIAVYPKSTRGTTFANFYNFFASGIKNAKTVEELAAVRVRVRLKVSDYCGDLLTKHNLEKKADIVIENTQHLVEAITEYENYYAGTNITIYLYPDNSFGLEQLIKAASQRVKHEKKRKELTHFFALKAPAGYFCRNVKRGYKVVGLPQYAKTFQTEQAAQRFRNKMQNADTFTVEKVDKTIVVYV